MSSTVLVTGANRGIGLAFVKQYLAKGYEVVAACRVASDELEATGAVLITGIDVTDADCGARLQEALGDKKIDILINNAGIFRNENLGSLDFESISAQFEVNALGPLRITEAVLGNLSRGSRIGLITSRMGSIEDNGSGAYYGYRMSKAALNAAGKSLANDLARHEIAVAILHPGFVQTDMVDYAGDISADTAAERMVQRMEGLNMTNTGSFWHSNGQALPW